MSTTQIEANNKIHPYKMLLWVGLGSIVMMFAGLTSAYIVKKSQANWLEFELPNLFWFSTIVILVSSFTIQMALKKAKAGDMSQYRGFLSVTAILGVTFIILQLRGFQALELNNVALTGARSNSAGSFLLVITGLHLLHLLAGVIALVFISIKAVTTKSTSNKVLPVELVATYWHFVDILWIYLFVFLKWVG
ncbi:MAG: cytochrome c oxidase subunit 3 [Sediminibacterium sp.]|jgi:cytochrome c oxidase subunit 3